MITSCIKSYILENKKVEIAHFGILELVYREAQVHPIRQDFTPPGHYLTFTADESVDGEAFAAYVAESSHIGLAEAVTLVARWVDEVKVTMASHREYELDGMGKFVMGNIRMEFVPTLDSDLSPDSFGLPPFTLRSEAETEPVAENKPTESKPELQPEPEKVEEPVTHDEPAAAASMPSQEGPGRKKRHIGRAIFYTLLVLLMLCIIAMGVYALLRPVEFVEKKDRCMAVVTEWFNYSTKDEQPQDNPSETDEMSDETVPADTIPVSDDTVQAVPEPVTEQCYIIVGGFGNPGNADNMVLKLKADYPNAVNLGLNAKGTLTMVGIGPYSRSEAEAKAVELAPVFKDCWILEK